MSVLCQVSSYDDGKSYRVLSKGAPEILKQFIKDPPADYDDVYLPFVRDGKRVLAIAYKKVEQMN